MNERWLCVRLPRLALDIFRLTGSDTPWAVRDGARPARILACNTAAQAAGVRAGQALEHARGCCRSLQLVERDPAAERAALDGLAAWAGQFSDRVCLPADDALCLEMAGSLRLFRGLDALLGAVRQGLRALGYRAGLASAPTLSAALLLARCGSELHPDTVGRLPAVLAPLPVSGLDWPEARIERLHGMGVRRMGELLRLPRDGLARRFGPGAVRDLDRLLGRVADPRPQWRPPARFRRSLTLPVAVADSARLLFAARRLILELCGWLRGRDAAIQELVLLLHHREADVTRLRLGFQRRRQDAAGIETLLRERLERQALDAPVTGLALHADRSLPLAATAADLFRPHGGEPCADLVDRLRARLGEARVRGLQQVSDHRPEYSQGFVDPGTTPGHASHTAAVPGHGPAVGGERPLWLLPVPRRLAVCGGRPLLHGRQLELLPGRERIESGWWAGQDVRRDYFMACDAGGNRYWVYRELEGGRGWYLHGLFE